MPEEEKEEEEEEEEEEEKEEEEEEEGEEEEEQQGGGGILAVKRTDRPHYYPFIWCRLCAGLFKIRWDKESRTECVTALCL